MKKILLFMLCVITLNSCVSYKLDNTVWCNYTSGELGMQKADITTYLCFYENNNICVNTCVKQDSTTIVPMTITSMGEYKCEKGKKNSATLELYLTDNYGLQETKRGVVTKEGLFLFETDTIARVYFKTSNLTLKNK